MCVLELREHIQVLPPLPFPKKKGKAKTLLDIKAILKHESTCVHVRRMCLVRHRRVGATKQRGKLRYFLFAQSTSLTLAFHGSGSAVSLFPSRHTHTHTLTCVMRHSPSPSFPFISHLLRLSTLFLAAIRLLAMCPSLRRWVVGPYISAIFRLPTLLCSPTFRALTRCCSVARRVA